MTMPAIEMPRHATWSLEQQVLSETAFHEAGHAVLAKLSGTHLVGAIDAQPESTQGAFDCVYRVDLHQARDYELGVTVDAVKESAVISAAGAAAQARFMFENKIGVDVEGKWTVAADAYVFNCASGDVREVRRTLGSGHWVNLTAVATQLLSEDHVWRAVEILATEVIRKNGAMSGMAVEDLLHEFFVQLDLPEFRALI